MEISKTCLVTIVGLPWQCQKDFGNFEIGKMTSIEDNPNGMDAFKVFNKRNMLLKNIQANNAISDEPDLGTAQPELVLIYLFLSQMCTRVQACND